MLKRVYELIIKMVSTKGLFAILASVGLFLGLIPDWMFFFAWALIIGAREINKAITIMKDAKSVIEVHKVE